MARFPENEIIALIGAAPQHDLGESYGPDLQLGEIVDPDCLRDLRLGYGTAQGSSELRTAIAGLYGVSAEEIVVTVGGAQALFLLGFILCGPGTDAVIPQPCFPMTRNVLQVVGTSLNVLQLSFDQNYRVDPAAVAKLLTARTKLVCIESPQSPSGVSTSINSVKAVLDEMERVCPDAYLLVDETYRDAAYGAQAIAPSVATLSDKVVTVTSLSKCHGAPGLRIGWAIVRDPDLRQQMITGKFNTVLSCSPLDEAIAVRLIVQRGAVLADRAKQLHDNLQLLRLWIRSNADFVEWVEPDAGALCCVRLKRDTFREEDVEDFYRVLAENGVRVGKGSWFGEEPRVFRLGFGLLSTVRFGHALTALTKTLRTTAKASNVWPAAAE